MGFLNQLGFGHPDPKANKILDYGRSKSLVDTRDHLWDVLIWYYIDENLVLNNRDGSFTRIFEYRGKDIEGTELPEQVANIAQINRALMNFNEAGYTLWFEAQRHVSREYRNADMPVPLLQMFENEREAYYKSRQHFETSFYLVVHFEATAPIKERISSLIVRKQSEGVSREEKIRAENYNKFLKTTDALLQQLRPYLAEIHLLDKDEIVTYLHSTVSTERQLCSYDDSQGALPLNVAVSDCSVTGGMNMMLGDKHMRIVTILNYPRQTRAGMYHALNQMNFEFRWVNRFIPMERQAAREKLKNTVQYFGQSARGLGTLIREGITGVSSTESLDESAVLNKQDAETAVVELDMNMVIYGEHTPTFIVLGSTEKEADERALIFKNFIQRTGGTAYVEDVNAPAAWFGSLPGHWKMNIYRPVISSLNFCHLAPLSASWAGDQENRHLHGPVLLYTDANGFTPFRLSLHSGEIGHTMVIGPTGAGKSVLLNTIEAHFTKYANSNVFIFDKSASSRCLTLALGGNFYNLASEGKGQLSFQPLARIGEDENERKWANEWLLAYLKLQKLDITPRVKKDVWDALQSESQFPQDQRTITLFCSLVQNQEIRQALEQLTVQGAYGKLFDNARDFSGSGRWQVYEMETLMQMPSIVAPTLDYLFHRIESQIRDSSGPSIIVMDECWLFLDNEIFASKLNEYFKDMRKKNTSIIIATQNLSDIAAKQQLFQTISGNVPNRIYLPNVTAGTGQTAELYRAFDCNDSQIATIANMVSKKEYYYCNREEGKGQRVFDLALRPAELPFVTATSKSDQKAMDDFIAGYGGTYNPAENCNDFIRYWLRYKGALDELETFEEFYLGISHTPGTD